MMTPRPVVVLLAQDEVLDPGHVRDGRQRLEAFGRRRDHDRSSLVRTTLAPESAMNVVARLSSMPSSSARRRAAPRRA